MKKTLVLILGLIFLLAWNYFEISKYKFEKISLSSTKLKSDLRICQISDFHSNSLIDLDRLYEDLEEADPDILVLTGDIIDRDTRSFDQALSLLDRLEGLNKETYMILGNHELDNPDLDLFLEEVSRRNLTLLRNQGIYLEDRNIYLLGMDFKFEKEVYRELLRASEPGSYVLSLCHSPKYPIDYNLGMEDLILSGHTHGGQLRLPFLGALVSPSEGLFPKYQKGLYDLGKSRIYIDSGLGNSLVAIRSFNRVSLSIIDLKTEDLK